MSEPLVQELVSERVLWVLSDHGGQIGRTRLRDILHIRMADLDPVLDLMELEGRIKISRPGSCRIGIYL